MRQLGTQHILLFRLLRDHFLFLTRSQIERVLTLGTRTANRHLDWLVSEQYFRRRYRVDTFTHFQTPVYYLGRVGWSAAGCLTDTYKAYERGIAARSGRNSYIKYKLYSPYLAWLHASKAFRAQYEAKAVGVTRWGLAQSAFKETLVPLPPLPEQERIAAYLDASCAAIDAAVTAKRQQLETLDALRKTVAHQVLSEGLRPGFPLKDSGIESIGVIPAHWDVKQLRYACEVNYGITLQLEKGQSEGDGVRILTVSNLTINGDLDLQDEYYIDPADLSPADYLQRGDLLFNWRNGSQYHVGKTAFFDLKGEFAHVSFLLRIRCGRHMNPFFLRSFLGILKDAGFFSGAKDKVNKTFNSTELKRLRVVIPPIDEQKEVCHEIERRAKEVNDVKAAIESQIAILTAYRKSLIHESVTGQRRITEAQLVHAEAYA